MDYLRVLRGEEEDVLEEDAADEWEHSRDAEAEDNKIAGRPNDLPDDVPAKATITIKEINDNRYSYWQWREGEKVISKYKDPVNLDE
ncbi:hypothetical protein [Natronomonas gomsonensis]|uniref:hypothetical protein n=1 Tax=Natronomonas gomsonensis TaxID=1046043 RepID=UPI00398C2F7C